MSNTIIGGAGNDTLNDGAGNDTLNGGAGDDTMAGGAGNDVYYVDSAADVVIEAPGGGTDRVLASVSYTLQAGQEIEVLAANAGAIGATGLVLTGNEFNNLIVGGAGNDTLDGGDGNDTLNGGAGDDTLNGGTGDDTLNGGTGNDTLNGGDGNDTFIANAASTGVYDGGAGTQNLLSLDLTQADWANANIQTDIANVQAFLHPNNGGTFQFTAFNLSITNIQYLDVYVDGVKQDFAPVITSNGGGSSASISTPENSTAVTTVLAQDPDLGDTLTYSISGGANASLFTIDPTTGALTWNQAPDYEQPTVPFTIGADGTLQELYQVQVRATDAQGLFSDQQLNVNVTDVNETSITVDGSLADWTQAERLDDGSAGGYAFYGDVQAGEFLFAIEDDNDVIGSFTTIYLDTDLNSTTGFHVFGSPVGAEYNITISGGVANLYSDDAAGNQTLIGPVKYAASADGHELEISAPSVLMGSPTAANVFADIADTAHGATLLPTFFTSEYRIGSLPPTTFGSITLDGSLNDWTPSARLDTPATGTPGYAFYGQDQNGTFTFALSGLQQIGQGTTIWLDTDINPSTGYQIFGVGAEYNITIGNDNTPRLYTGAAGQDFVADLAYNYSADHKTIEIALPSSLMAGTPTVANVLAGINNNSVDLPSPSSSSISYVVAQPQPANPSMRVAIVYSDTSASLYFNQTAYSDLIMAAQNQARMAGVSYDLIDESALTDINNLTGYAALIFPSMADVNTAQLPAIVATLTSAVYNYHIGIITSGDFLTNDQNGVALAGNSYANMQTLLDLKYVTGGSGASFTVTVNDAGNPIMQSYSPGQTIQSYADASYAEYQGVNAQADVLVNQNVVGVGTLPGVVETTTGGKNIHFATPELLGDSNLLSNAIQQIVAGPQPGVALDISRFSGVVAVRMDMDQSQFQDDVSPASGPGTGIYDKLLPILAGWKQQYDFVGTYFLNIGDNPNNPNGAASTNWAVSLPYYQQILDMGGEIGTHSYTHLINPPTLQSMTDGSLSGWTEAETTKTATAAGSTQVTLNALPSFYGITVGMIVTGVGIGTTLTAVPGTNGDSISIANTFVSAVSPDSNTITLSYVPGGFGTPNLGTIADIPAGATLTFGIPAENTNFLQTDAGITTGDLPGEMTNDPFTYDYEFNQSKMTLAQKLGTPIYGAAVPGANETYATDQYILPYFQSVPGTSVGYLSGGWTGIGSGYPSAIGYMSPGDQGSLYIAPNMTFDFTEIQYEGKTLEQAEADWAAQFSTLTANAAGTPIVVLPIHDYGVAAWNTDTSSGTGSPYSTQMYTDFISQAYANNEEFVTMEDLASRIEAAQKADIKSVTAGNTVTATVTPDPTAPDVGEMALNIVNGGADVIQSVTNWYAYNTHELFLPRDGGTFAVNLGATQDDVTHLSALPMRGDLQSVTGDGTNLGFTFDGAGTATVNLHTQAASGVIVTGADSGSVAGSDLSLNFAANGAHTAQITYVPGGAITGAANELIFGGSGDDMITTDGGTNSLYGGGGDDTFIFAAGSGIDTVQDFTTSFDHLDLSTLGYGSAQDALAAFTPGSAGLTLSANQGHDMLILAGITTGGLTANDIKVA
ncbi:MAG TPA: cadherin domain-containing protein [Stellaceae bacterium]|nr:cadherin domain-containing protein [Stellaceae bacterium]